MRVRIDRVQSVPLGAGPCGAAAIGIVAFIPTFGVGRRSPGYIIYYTTPSIVILVFTTIPTILVRITEVREEGSFVDNCYCFASVSGGGTDSYVVISYGGLLDDISVEK